LYLFDASSAVVSDSTFKSSEPVLATEPVFALASSSSALDPLVAGVVTDALSSAFDPPQLNKARENPAINTET